MTSDAKIAELALEGVRERLESFAELDDAIIVVNVAWTDEFGNQRAIGTAVPDDHGHELLALSLRQSAEEAEG